MLRQLELRLFDATPHFHAVIFQQQQHRFIHQHNRNQVNQRHHAHGQITHIPHHRHLRHRAKVNKPQHQQTEHQQHKAVAVQIFHIGFGVGIVADNRGEGKQKQHHRQKLLRPAADLAFQRRLRELDAA